MQFWYNDPYILYREYYDVIPSTNDQLERKLNAISRLSLYIGIILSIVDIRFLLIPIFVFPLTMAVHAHYTDTLTEPLSSDKTPLYQTTDNPYMNPMPYDDIPVERVPKENETPDETADRAKSDLADERWENLYQSFDEIYNSNVAKRQFYSLPSPDPVESRNDFLKAAMANEFPETSCKEGDGEQCLANIDVGYERMKR